MEPGNIWWCGSLKGIEETGAKDETSSVKGSREKRGSGKDNAEE